MEKIYTPEDLKSLYFDLKKRLKKQPTKRDWCNDKETPSEMPVRLMFQRWNLFLLYCGDKPIHYTKVSYSLLFKKIIEAIPEIKIIIDREYQRGYKDGSNNKLNN